MQDLATPFLTTRELADLLRIKERKVYELAAADAVPCLRVTGKLLFPAREIEAWLAHHTTGNDAWSTESAQVFAGSHDPLLEWALRESGADLATHFDGSENGLDRFADGGALATALHLHEPELDDWNVTTVARRFGHAPVVLVEFAWRERGLIVAESEVATYADGIAALRGRRVVPRQPGAGSQGVLDHLLHTAGIAANELDFTPPARTETDAALAILEGKADAALGLLDLARRYRLGFVPLLRERFDLLIDRRAWFEPPMQSFLAFCRSERFREKAAESFGYDISGFGRVHFNGG
ncbi:MAG: helix-turn-helix transcriptional regulator [Gammaproteobacteria bacterium]|nr:helix-turn-helix transcriptional regulator [Gammaproteobacteria bacterium]